VYSIYHLQKNPPYLLLFMWVVHTKWWENIKCILLCKHSVCKNNSHTFLSKFSYCSSNSKPHWISHKQITFCMFFSYLEKHNCKDHSKSISQVVLWTCLYLNLLDEYKWIKKFTTTLHLWLQILIVNNPPHGGCAGCRIGTRFLRPKGNSPLKGGQPRGNPGV
jgi:hypothetical protein